MDRWSKIKFKARPDYSSLALDKIKKENYNKNIVKL